MRRARLINYGVDLSHLVTAVLKSVQNNSKVGEELWHQAAGSFAQNIKEHLQHHYLERAEVAFRGDSSKIVPYYKEEGPTFDFVFFYHLLGGKGTPFEKGSDGLSPNVLAQYITNLMYGREHDLGQYNGKKLFICEVLYPGSLSNNEINGIQNLIYDGEIGNINAKRLMDRNGDLIKNNTHAGIAVYLFTLPQEEIVRGLNIDAVRRKIKTETPVFEYFSPYFSPITAKNLDIHMNSAFESMQPPNFQDLLIFLVNERNSAYSEILKTGFTNEL